MDDSTPDARCPYCRSGLRRVPGMWLGRNGFECDRCGEFIDFSRKLTPADHSGEVDDGDGGDPLDGPAQSL